MNTPQPQFAATLNAQDQIFVVVMNVFAQESIDSSVVVLDLKDLWLDTHDLKWGL